MIDCVKIYIKRLMPELPFIDSIMSAECIKIANRKSLYFKNYDIENFQLHNPVVLVEDDISVQCYIDYVPYQKGVNKIRLFFESLCDAEEDSFRIILGKIYSLEFINKNFDYNSIIAFDFFMDFREGTILTTLVEEEITAKLSKELLDGLSENVINGLKPLMEYYKNETNTLHSIK